MLFHCFIPFQDSGISFSTNNFCGVGILPGSNIIIQHSFKMNRLRLFSIVLVQNFCREMFMGWRGQGEGRCRILDSLRFQREKPYKYLDRSKVQIFHRRVFMNDSLKVEGKLTTDNYISNQYSKNLQTTSAFILILNFKNFNFKQNANNNYYIMELLNKSCIFLK